jgi:hypothetical protein
VLVLLRVAVERSRGVRVTGQLGVMNSTSPGRSEDAEPAESLARRIGQLDRRLGEVGDRIEKLRRQVNRLLWRACLRLLLRVVALFLALWVTAGFLLELSARM